MQKIYPDYYNQFSCIASACKHSCCVSWEIDIDAKTLKKYSKIKGELGEKLSDNIIFDQTPRFRNKEDGRCPFLEQNNLCELITKLGQKSLCYICANHPRFYNFLSDRTEIGLGISCEEVARIILSKKEKTKFVAFGEKNKKELSKKRLKIIEKRDEIISILQDRTIIFTKRLKKIQKEFSAKISNENVKRWWRVLSKLEILDKTWLNVLKLLKADTKKTDYLDFENKFPETEIEFEQLAVYFAYRHLINACDWYDFSDRVSFLLLAIDVIKKLIVGSYKITGTSKFTDRIEIIRQFSAEIEYSENNFNDVLDQITLKKAGI